MRWFSCMLFGSEGEEGEVERERFDLVGESDVVVAELEGLINVIFLGVSNDSFEAFCVARDGFAFDENGLAVLPDDKVDFESRVFVEVV